MSQTQNVNQRTESPYLAFPGHNWKPRSCSLWGTTKNPGICVLCGGMFGRSEDVQLEIVKMWQEGQNISDQEFEGQSSASGVRTTKGAELGPVGDNHMGRDTLWYNIKNFQLEAWATWGWGTTFTNIPVIPPQPRKGMCHFQFIGMTTEVQS